jgi:hypothetical protein
MRKKGHLAVITGATAALLLSSVVPAWSSGVPLAIGDGTLGAKGASVSVPVTFTCVLEDGRTTETVQVLLKQQLSPKRHAEGSGAKEVACTGATQTVEVTVIAGPKNGGSAFRNGDATATLRIGDLAGEPEPLTKTVRLGN